MEFKSFSQEMRIDRVSFTPVHSSALFEFLSECEKLKIFFYQCKFLDNHSCLPMKNCLLNVRAEISIYLRFICFNFGKYFWNHLSKALKSESCKHI